MQNIKKNHRDLISKNSNIKSYIRDSLLKHIFQDGLLRNKLLSSPKKVRFNIQEFSINILISNIKYLSPRSQNNNLFYLFYNQLNYILAYYFAKSKITKNNINKFLS